MNRVNKDELFTHLSAFLKTKGVELQSGSYASAVEKGCQVLADTINLSQQAVERAKAGIEQNLEKARKIIHEKTAARKPSAQPQREAEPDVTTKTRQPRRPSASRKPRSKPVKSRRKSPK